MTFPRRQFIKLGCSCLAGTSLAGLVLGCSTTHYVAGTLEPTGISIQLTDFTLVNGAKVTQRDYVIVRNEKLEFPVCVYRFSDTEYSALLMKCTHQGTELQVAGDHLHCPAHGSEFNNKGEMIQGPAATPLRTFRVQVQEAKLTIELR